MLYTNRRQPIVAIYRELRRYSGILCFAVLQYFTLPVQAQSATDPLHEEGRRIYNFRCYYCHGYSGDARTLAAQFLNPPPRDFSALGIDALGREAMIDAVTHGRPNTAMKPFRNTLSTQEVAAVVDFVRIEFMKRKSINTRYHTEQNGWPNHERYQAAFPFASGEIALDAPWESLDEQQRAGKQLYLASCISCHDRSHVSKPNLTWERQALSYPRFGFQTGDFLKSPDALSGASPFAIHDLPLVIHGLSTLEQQGERLYLDNCAFCHAADGSGANWIGRFLQPHPRDLTDPIAMAGMSRSRLRRTIVDGIDGTSMPAWGSVLTQHQIDALIAYIHRAFHPLAEE